MSERVSTGMVAAVQAVVGLTAVGLAFEVPATWLGLTWIIAAAAAMIALGWAADRRVRSAVRRAWAGEGREGEPDMRMLASDPRHANLIMMLWLGPSAVLGDFLHAEFVDGLAVWFALGVTVFVAWSAFRASASDWFPAQRAYARGLLATRDRLDSYARDAARLSPSAAPAKVARPVQAPLEADYSYAPFSDMDR